MKIVILISVSVSVNRVVITVYDLHCVRGWMSHRWFIVLFFMYRFCWSHLSVSIGTRMEIELGYCRFALVFFRLLLPCLHPGNFSAASGGRWLSVISWSCCILYFPEGLLIVLDNLIGITSSFLNKSSCPGKVGIRSAFNPSFNAFLFLHILHDLCLSLSHLCF